MVDFVRPTDELDAYAIVIVPTLFAASDEALGRLRDYESRGGSLVVTYQSAITDENLKVRLDGYLGPLQKTLGVRIELFAPPAPPDLLNSGALPAADIQVEGFMFDTPVQAGTWAELVDVVDADVLATFAKPLNSPAVTRRRAAGSSWYIATSFEGVALSALTNAILSDTRLADSASKAPHPSLEVVRRGNACFVINHGTEPATAEEPGFDIVSSSEGPIILAPHQCAIFIRTRDELESLTRATRGAPSMASA